MNGGNGERKEGRKRKKKNREIWENSWLEGRREEEGMEAMKENWRGEWKV